MIGFCDEVVVVRFVLPWPSGTAFALSLGRVADELASSILFCLWER